jgi:hypothetical protein
MRVRSLSNVPTALSQKLPCLIQGVQSSALNRPAARANPLALCLSRTPSGLRVKSNFLSRIRLFLPVQSHLKKYSGFPKPQITFITPPSTPLEGRIAIVTDAGLDAMDAGGASDESVLLADGEVVWS